MFSAPTNNRSRSNVKKLILIILTPAVQTKDQNDVTIRSKSNAGSRSKQGSDSSYQDNWEAVFGKKAQSPTLH